MLRVLSRYSSPSPSFVCSESWPWLEARAPPVKPTSAADDARFPDDAAAAALANARHLHGLITNASTHNSAFLRVRAVLCTKCGQLWVDLSCSENRFVQLNMLILCQ